MGGGIVGHRDDGLKLDCPICFQVPVEAVGLAGIGLCICSPAQESIGPRIDGSTRLSAAVRFEPSPPRPSAVSGSLDTLDRYVCGRGYVVTPALALQPLKLGEGALQPAIVQGLVFEDAVEGFRVRDGMGLDDPSMSLFFRCQKSSQVPPVSIDVLYSQHKFIHSCSTMLYKRVNNTNGTVLCPLARSSEYSIATPELSAAWTMRASQKEIL